MRIMALEISRRIWSESAVVMLVKGSVLRPSYHLKALETRKKRSEGNEGVVSITAPHFLVETQLLLASLVLDDLQKEPTRLMGRRSEVLGEFVRDDGPKV